MDGGVMERRSQLAEQSLSVDGSGGIEILHLTKRYGNTLAVDDFSLKVKPGSFVALLGPSGCGKTTTLRMLAGLESPTSGQILLDGMDVARVPAGRRPVGLVPQDYAVFPEMTLRKNLGFALRLRKSSAAEIDNAVAEVAQQLELTDVLDKFPSALNQSELQRAAIGRTLVSRPRFILFDEPLSNLEAGLRTRMRMELSRLHSQLGHTSIYVTHDQIEAMSLADTIALMNSGRLVQTGTPDDIYRRPADVFAAGFIGSPPINLLPAEVTYQEGKPAASSGELCVEFPADLTLPEDRRVTMGIRPENVKLNAPNASSECSVRGTVLVVEPLGSETVIELGGNGWSLTSVVDGRVDVKVNDKILVSVATESVHWFAGQGLRLFHSAAKGGD
jgi:ABC-type sugar transport system ATPase subunit